MGSDRSVRGFAAALAAVMVLAVGAARAAADAEASKRAYQAGKGAGSKSESRRLYQDGIARAREVLAQNPDDPGGLLWYSANLGAEALSRGKLQALRVIPELERTLLRLEQVAPGYDHAAAARSLGRLYHKAPPLISIGSKDKAAAYYEKALSRAPDFPGNQAFAAELYLDRHDCARARPLADRLLARGDLEQRFGSDAREWREIADAVRKSCK